MSKSNLKAISRIIDENIERVIASGFARYSKHIIQERALPDVRDGLKPVQRRILYAMYKEKNTSDKPYRKSAKTVGVVIGNYHPHGDGSVYDAMVRLSQDWKMRVPLVDMHGNNGSIDNDPPAAMRYTEARLAAIAEEMLRDIDQYTVEFAPNFDDTEKEPTVLPSRFPNVLVNGSQGISAGYATDIPPHNLGEVIDAVIYRLKHPFSSLEEIMSFIKGPDFPTGGIVQGLDGIIEAYKTGKGKIVVRCKYEFDDKNHQIIISNIPYDVNKATLMKKLEDIRLEKVLEGFEEARDESDQHGLRIVIECSKDANMELIMNYLLKNTDLKINYNFNMVMIHNKHPKQMGLLEILDAYIEHQKEVIINRSHYQLAKAQKRLHIIEGLIKMVSIVDEVIKVIRKSTHKADAKANLIETFAFTEEQAEAIVSLQLYRLTTTDIYELEQEGRELKNLIKYLNEVLNHETELIKVIIDEITTIKKRYPSERLTEIQAEVEEIQIDHNEMIKEEDVALSVTKEGYIRVYRHKGEAITVDEKLLNPHDYVIANLVVNTLNSVLIFTNKGNYLLLHVHQIDIGKINEFQHINDYVKIEPDEYIIKVIPVKSFETEDVIILSSKYGSIKRTPLAEFNVTRNSKTYVAMMFKDEEDELVSVALSDDCNRDLLIITKSGYVNKFNEEQVSLMKLKASGVKSINLKENDEVVSMVYLSNVNYRVVMLTNRGNIKVINPEELPFSVRSNRGTMTLKHLKRNNHHYIGAALIHREQMLVVQGKAKNYTITCDTQNYSELVSNGKAHPDLAGDEDLLRVTDCLTNQCFIFTHKEKKKQAPKPEKPKFEQIELFNIDNLTQ